MHQRAITIADLADFLETATDVTTVRTAAVWTNVGFHPSFGSFVSLQDSDPEWLIIHTQFPLDLPFPAHLTLANGPSALAA